MRDAWWPWLFSRVTKGWWSGLKKGLNKGGRLFYMRFRKPVAIRGFGCLRDIHGRPSFRNCPHDRVKD